MFIAGTMRELGDEAAALHVDVAAALVALRPDVLVVTGDFVPAIESVSGTASKASWLRHPTLHRRAHWSPTCWWATSWWSSRARVAPRWSGSFRSSFLAWRADEMLYHLLGPLGKSVILFNLFNYISFRAAGAMVTALLIAFVVGPGVIRRLHAHKVGQVIRADGPGDSPGEARDADDGRPHHHRRDRGADAPLGPPRQCVCHHCRDRDALVRCNRPAG